MKEKILITGATGFIGANLARRLLKEDYEVNILTRETSNMWRLKDIYLNLVDWKVDLNEREKLKNIIKKIRPDYIIHLAIYGGRPNEKDTKKIMESNLQGTINLVDACKEINYKIFINTGSSSEYGKKDKPMREIDICEPTNIYGIAKVGATLYCNYIANRDNKNIGTLRLFSPFGDYEDKGRLFPDIIVNALKNKDIELANPNSVRDFISIQETIDLYLKIIKENLNIKGEIFNCAYGEQHSVEYVANKIIEITNTASKLKFGAILGRDSDTTSWVGDISKAKDKLGWSPKSKFEDSLVEVCNWFKENINLY
ncbi:SDR family NAD(P)-dependent oxidoreductase [Cetobacterium sp. 2A]|uniref:NAD-dependent epimerase/dehydratase family protein n=1 Tax=Cetobacterium sp. 2A TaxID=2754723 RepID=UPI00163C9534|nr:SDR family NAD(P)-dependent oxidoreductase [Cetobacterium sp. 2A]MBC2856157.1 SDR family NAD(P)-dependent oxidoreductase [Cetobacterium sp. 2A]